MPTYAADSFFTIGYPHVNQGIPCQDYAVSGVGNGFAYAIVSDGCSSSPDTDIGSRLVALSARNFIQQHRGSINPKSSFYDAAATAEKLNVNPLSLDATLCSVIVQDKTKMVDPKTYELKERMVITASIYGDGVIAAKFRDGVILVYKAEWSKNAPGYLNYHNKCFADRVQNFSSYYGAELALKVTRTLISPGGVESETIERECNAIEGMNGFSLELPSDCEYIAVMSDGVTAVDGCNTIDVIKDLMNFKNTTGEFVKRRALAAQRGWYKNGKGPADDLSIAVIHIMEDENVND